MKPPRSKLCTRLAATALLCGTGTATATELLMGPKLSLTAQLGSNPRQTTLREETENATGAQLDAALRLEVRRATTALTLTPRLLVYRFDKQNLNRTDEAIAATLDHEFSPRLKAHIDADYSEQSVLDEQGDTAFGSAQNKRKSWTATPRLSWQLSAASTLQAEVSYLSARYEDKAAGFSDFTYRRESLRLSHQFTPRFLASVEGFEAGFRNQDDGSQSDDFGGTLNIEGKLTPRLSVLASGGFNNNRFSCGAEQAGGGSAVCVRGGRDTEIKSNSGEVLGRLELLNRFSETTQGSLGYEHAIGASGRGTQLLRDRFHLTAARQVSARLDLRTEASFQKSHAASKVAETSSLPGANNDLGRVQAEARYRWLESWLVGGGYRYRYRKEENASATRSHSPYLFITYDPAPRSVLRW